MNHADRAKELFQSGYNCAQSVLCAFTDVTGLGFQESARIASSFGGGMGRLREVCGAVSGALIVLGEACGYSDPSDQKAKEEHYHRVQAFAARFREINGSILCRDLLRETETVPGSEPEPRTEEYYERRPCSQLVWDAAELTENMLAELRTAGEEKRP